MAVITVPTAKPPRLKWLTIGILAVGFGCAIVTYFTAAARPDNPLGYDPLQRKQYLRDLEMYGGTANVIAAQIRDWFVGLWYGKKLAFTVAFLTVVLVLVVRILSIPLPSRNYDLDRGTKRPPEA